MVRRRHNRDTEDGVSEEGFVYRSSVALGCLILMLASIACTGWFFYSWLGGIPGIVGAGVGCAVQIMAYGFSGVIVHQSNGVLRVILFLLIASALALSVLSSYATLNGYFTALHNQDQAKRSVSEQREAARQAALTQRLQLMESMSRDVEISSDAANQGLADKYRTQASSFLENNNETRERMLEQIEQLEALASSDTLAPADTKEASPIDGLAGVLGGQTTAIMILCIWLAIMFDALPIVGITLFETKAKNRVAAKQRMDAETDDDTYSYLELEENRLSPRLGNPELGSDHRLEDQREPEFALEDHKVPSQYRLLTNICSVDLPATRQFFVDLLGFEAKYDSDWYIQLCAPDDPEIEFGVIQYDHELVPVDYRRPPSGMYLTVVVPDVDAVYEQALELGVEILQAPRNEFYGQRRLLAKEPSGCLIDISSPFEEAELEEESSYQEFAEA